MKQFLLVAFLFSCLTLTGQMNISPNPITVEASHRAEDIQIDFTVENENEDAPAEFLWRIANTDDIPDEWEAYVCDINLCYTPFVHTCPEANSNNLDPAASHVFNFHVKPNDTEGKFTFVFELFDVNDVDNVYATTEITLCALSTSTNDQVSKENFSLFPNPTIESFQITNDENVRDVVIYNIVGKQLQQYRHFPGKFYNVSDLRKGMYLVRLFDADGKTLKSLRLSRK